MTATLAGSPEAAARARDWAEIQERMLVPLYETVYDRLDVSPRTRLLGLGCGSGLALVLAAGRGALVSGVENDPDRRALARERRLDVRDRPALPAGSRRPFTLLTAFGTEGGPPDLSAALPLLERGAAVVLTGWGPPERCTTLALLPPALRPRGRDVLEKVAQQAGLVPDGSGRVLCPFGYADLDSAVRGLLSTGLFDAALRGSEPPQAEKELAECLHPHVRPDGTVWMPNVFRYLIARVP
ncbi:SAM-dependent methyltransferase [Streptomyces sp. NPDC006879]|uniref:SAM-dependent methyltransferase n=1 Tax=Streptomyces sp. NPDC006879 TaxID=3364767 RepID=UPI0036C00516